MKNTTKNAKTKNGRFVHCPNPQRPAVVGLAHVPGDSTPISKKEAQTIAADRGLSLPTQKGISIPTPDGRQLVSRITKKGAITYKFAII